MTKYIARYNDQIIGTRDTKKSGKTYTHAIVVTYKNDAPRVASWSGRPDLAQKQVSQWKLNPDYTAVAVPAEVVEPTKKEKREKFNQDMENALKAKFPGMNIKVI